MVWSCISDDGADLTQDGPKAKVKGIRDCLDFWRGFCSSRWVLAWLEHGFVLWWKGAEPAPKYFQNHGGAVQHADFVSRAISDLLEAGAIVCTTDRPKVVSPLNVVPKKNGKLRLILDLRYVNDHLAVPKFKYESLKSLEDIMLKTDYVFGCDLSNGYWQVHMHPSTYQYLGLEWQGKYYMFKCLPFGLASAPWCFSKIMQEFSGFLRRKGIRLLNYLDDFLFLAGPDQATATGVRDAVLQAFNEAGLALNYEKSQLAPARSITCLGYDIDAEAGTFAIPLSRWEALQSVVKDCLRHAQVPARQLAAVTGHIASMSLALGGTGRLFTRACHALISTATGWNSSVTLSAAARDELVFWSMQSRTRFTGRIWRPADVVSFVVNSDASDNGWAAVIQNADIKAAKGDFEPAIRNSSSGFRELLAIFYAMQSYVKFFAGRRVMLLTDSQNADAIVDHGSRKPHLQQIAVDIFHFCDRNRIDLAVAWVPRALNVLADAYSKNHDLTDWQLHPAVFAIVDEYFGPHEVDRFASHSNKLLDRFNSMFWCPGTDGVDCFSQIWKGVNNWCNPPFNLIGRLIRFLHAQEAVATVVVPVWTARPWWPLLCPDGVCFGKFVTGFFPLPMMEGLFTPGPCVSSPVLLGRPRWRALALRLSFEPGWESRSVAVPVPSRHAWPMHPDGM